MSRVRIPRSKRSRKSRIDAREWLEAALRRLADGGVENVRIEPIASDLGITKGAFYARYANRDALLDAMLEYWLEESTAAVIALYASVKENPPARLERILLTPFRRPDFRERARMEQAIRLWSHEEPRAARTMAQVDADRLAYMESVLRENGFPPNCVTGRAYMIYAYVLAEGTMAHTPDSNTRRYCRELLTRP